MNAQAQCETLPRLRKEYENLALAYLRLAEQADRNAKTDLVIETRSDGAPIVHLQTLDERG